MTNKLCGIYCIRHDDKFYIGQSVNMKGRWARHRLNFKNGIGNPKIQNAWNKYGGDSFHFEVIEICDRNKELLTTREQYWMDTLDSINAGFNCGLAGDATVIGMHHSDETKRRLSLRFKGIPRSEEIKEKIKKSVTKEAQSPEGRKRRSKNMKGHHHSEETKNLIASKHRGKHHSAEWCKAIALGNTGRITSDETKEKLRAAKIRQKIEKEHANISNQSGPDMCTD